MLKIHRRRLIVLLTLSASLSGPLSAPLGAHAAKTKVKPQPKWVAAQIAQAEKTGEVEEIGTLSAGGKTFYRLQKQCCDQFNPLLDASGKALCAWDGGFTGAGDGKCPDFTKTEEFRNSYKKIWRKK